MKSSTYSTQYILIYIIVLLTVTKTKSQTPSSTSNVIKNLGTNLTETTTRKQTETRPHRQFSPRNLTIHIVTPIPIMKNFTSSHATKMTLMPKILFTQNNMTIKDEHQITTRRPLLKSKKFIFMNNMVHKTHNRTENVYKRNINLNNSDAHTKKNIVQKINYNNDIEENISFEEHITKNSSVIDVKNEVSAKDNELVTTDISFVAEPEPEDRSKRSPSSNTTEIVYFQEFNMPRKNDVNDLAEDKKEFIFMKTLKHLKTMPQLLDIHKMSNKKGNVKEDITITMNNQTQNNILHMNKNETNKITVSEAVNKSTRSSLINKAESLNMPIENTNNRNDYLTDEQEDEKEFIFMKILKFGEKVPLELYKIVNDAIYLKETTTETITSKPTLKIKRSVNVIEEENLGTTLSGFKFTGRDSKLDSNIGFKNINV